MPHRALVTTGLETVLNGYFSLDSDVLARLATLDGKVLAIEFSGLDIALFVLPRRSHIRVFDTHTKEPDVLIRGTPLALIRMARGTAADVGDTGVFVKGDAHTAKAFQDMLKAVDIDWEELLSRWIGDIAAHQVGNAARNTAAWGNHALETMSCNVNEYLQHESRDLPSRYAMNEFLDAVDTLRNDADRLEARVHRLRALLVASRPSGNAT